MTVDCKYDEEKRRDADNESEDEHMAMSLAATMTILMRVASGECDDDAVPVMKETIARQGKVLNLMFQSY